MDGGREDSRRSELGRETGERLAVPSIRADRVLRNANVITVDTRAPRAQAVAVKDGRILAVGSNEDADAFTGPGTHVDDLGGATVLPGFIDAHIHVLSSGTRHVMEADCDRRSIAEVKAALSERLPGASRGDWIRGFKFDDTKTAEFRFLFKEDLDAVTTELPVLVSHRAGHVSYANGKALELAGYTRDSADPPGGRLGRDPATGDLNGVVYERAIEPFRPLLPAVTDESRAAGLRLIDSMLTSAGLTSVHDARVSADELRAYQDGRDNGDLSMRVYALMGHEFFPHLRDGGVKSGMGDDRLRIGGIKLVSDGAIATRTAWLSEPYVGSEDDHGIQALSKEEIEEAVMEIHRAGFQVCIHANGDLAIDMVVTAYEKAQAKFPRGNERHRVEHCTVVNPDLLSRMSAAGVIATPFCTYVYYHGEKMPFYGADRLQWMFAQRSFIDSGVVSTGATDYPPGPYEPLMGVQACVTRTDSEGNVWGPDQRVSVEEALKIYTLNGAYAGFEEDVKGSITPGKLADFVVLAEDPTAVDPLTIMDIPIQQTIIGGRTAHEA